MERGWGLGVGGGGLANSVTLTLTLTLTVAMLNLHLKGGGVVVVVVVATPLNPPLIANSTPTLHKYRYSMAEVCSLPVNKDHLVAYKYHLLIRTLNIIHEI